jgi:hypothetical protein
MFCLLQPNTRKRKIFLLLVLGWSKNIEMIVIYFSVTQDSILRIVSRWTTNTT